MTLEAYEEVQRNLLGKKIEEVFHGLECTASAKGNVLVFRYDEHLSFRICDDMLISVPYNDITHVEEIELEMSGGKALQVTTKAGYECILHI